MEGSVVPIQHGCYESWRGFVTKRNIGTCALLVMRCALAFDFFLQLQRNLADISISLHSDPDQKLSIHSLQWTRVFVPVWLLTIYPFCHNLYNLVCVEFDSGNRNSHLYHGFTPYVCLAWGCAFSLGVSNGVYLAHFRHIVRIVCAFTIDFLVDNVQLCVVVWCGAKYCFG